MNAPADRSFYRVGAFIEGAPFRAFTKGVDEAVGKPRYAKGDFVIAGHNPVTIEEKSGTLFRKPGLYASPLNPEAQAAIKLDQIRRRLQDLASSPYAGLAMQRDVRALMDKHGLEPRPAAEVPIAGVHAVPLILEGHASTTDIRVDRLRFGPGALRLPERVADVPLLLNHDMKDVVGSCEDLSFDVFGALQVRAWVDRAWAARHNAFSLGVRVTGYELVDADKRSFYADARADVVEVSLVERPMNRYALVKTRRAPTKMEMSHHALMLSFARVRESLKQVAASWAKAA